LCVLCVLCVCVFVCLCVCVFVCLCVFLCVFVGVWVCVFVCVNPLQRAGPARRRPRAAPSCTSASSPPPPRRRCGRRRRADSAGGPWSPSPSPAAAPAAAAAVYYERRGLPIRWSIRAFDQRECLTGLTAWLLWTAADCESTVVERSYARKGSTQSVGFAMRQLHCLLNRSNSEV
jgi:hypothetical protein